MASGTGSGFIKRNRPPRVQIAYADPYESDKMIELPFVMGVMADLSGNASQVEKPPVGQRNFTNISMDTLDDYVEKVAPAVAATVEDKLSGEEGQKLSVNLEFKKMDDFDPAAIARQVPALAKLMEARDQLSNLQRYMNGKSAAQDQLRELLNDPDLMKALADKRAEAMGSDDESDSDK